ncbi:hypothetical protein EK904_014752, partial [Melospiza melodia maxima]
VQEWLCLNCQTQRAMSGQLGDMGKVPLLKTGPSQPTSKPAASPQKRPVPAVSHSPQKSSTPPTPAAAKPKEEPGAQKEAPKLQQGRLEKTLSADKIQQGIQKEDGKPKPGKLVKTPSADKIQLASQKEDPRIQQTKLTKTASYDRVLQDVQKEDEKLQEAKLAKTSSADKILQRVQKEDIKLQEAKLAKVPSADKILQGIQKEDPKLQQMKMAKALSADKIQPAAQREDTKLQEIKLPKAASVDKIQHGIQKDIKLQHEKLKKTSSVDKIQEEGQKEETKLQRGKLSKTPSADKIPAATTADQKIPLSTLEEDKETVLPEKSTPHPEDKKAEITTEIKGHVAEEKAEVEAPYKGMQAKEQEDVKKEDLTTGISQEVLKAEKAQEAEIPVQTAPLPGADHVEAVREKIEKEDDKSDTSSSQQQKSPQGLSDTGYSSDGISSSLGEIPSHIPTDEKDLHKEISKKDTIPQESPPSPSDLAKLESTVLSILEAQASTLSDEKSVKSKELSETYGEQTKDQLKTKPLPVTPESYSSDEEDLKAIKEGEGTIVEEGKGTASSQAQYKEEHEGDDISARRQQRYDSVEDSSESENSPVPSRKRRTSVGSSSSDEYKRDDSQGSGDEEDFIRKQIIEMSADEDASGSEDDEFIRNQLKEISAAESQKKEEVKSKAKGTPGKHRRMARKSSAGYDEDAGRRHSWHDDDDETFDESPEPKYRESKSQDSEELAVSGGGGLRRFKTIELNSTITNKYSEVSEPQKVSSLDEDSDSSPSHKKLGGESKQQRKARHRTHGPLLPTIEDSSEEEELREEEELLKEQEKQRELEQQQRKSSSKKSKKDKDELRAQRRRERPKTPPSNLSPIEDASPTEELRQAAEMEELHRSSCSEYSPSIESEPEGFEISPEKIIEVQKVYKLPTAVSLYSPTDEQPTGLPKEESVTETVTVVTCTATVSYTTSTDSLVDLGHAMTTPLQLTTSKHFEPAYRVTGSQAFSADRFGYRDDHYQYDRSGSYGYRGIGASEVYTDVVDDEVALLIAPEEGKQQQLDLERELLELEKIKQQRFAEELEWEQMSLKDIDVREEKQLKKRSSMPKLRGPYEEFEETLEEPRCFKKIVDSGVQTDDEDGAERGYTNRRRRSKKSVDTSVQTDDEDQDEWDLSSRSRRKPRVGKFSESTTEADKAKPFSKKDKKRPTPLEIGYTSHLRPDSTLQVVPSPPKSPKVLYSPISPVSPSKVIESAFVPYEKPMTDDISPQKMLHADMAKVPPSSPKTAKMMQRSMSDPKPLSPTAEDSSRAQFQYTEGFM